MDSPPGGSSRCVVRPSSSRPSQAEEAQAKQGEERLAFDGGAGVSTAKQQYNPTLVINEIAWQTVNAVRRSQSKRFTRGFLVVTPGITIKDRLRVLYPNDPDSYYASRELVPGDMLVLVDDGRGDDDLLHLVVEIKGYRREDAKEKKATMDTYWVPAVNNIRTLGRWAFAELTEIYQIESDFKAKVESAFDEMIARTGGTPPAVSA